MALRVLLADESSTIKKAIQVVLSDYGVEVKTVPTGIDVLSVTQSFNPDLIIADVLLNKKNGYEVCQELKNTPGLDNIPVILMWSSFMQLDEDLFRTSKANASIEKPFDADTIRNLVEKLVPRLQTFPLKGFLNHPPMPDFEESDTFIKQKNTYLTLLAEEKTKVLKESTAISNDPTLVIEGSENKPDLSLSEPTQLVTPDFTQQTPEVKIPTPQPIPQPAPTQTPQSHPTGHAGPPEEWMPAKTNQFVIETEDYGDFEEVKVISSKGQGTPNLNKRVNEHIQSYLEDSPVAAFKAKSSLNTQVTSTFDEQLMKEEIRQIAEKVCWQVIPEITEKIVREELKKLLEGIEKGL